VRSAVAGALATVLLLAGCGGQASSTGGLHGNELDPPFRVSGTKLTDTSGAAYSLTSSTDKPLTLVFFGYTNCPDICGIVMANLATAMTRLDQADRDRVDVVFVTTDPARDTGRVLRAYLDRFDPSFIGLTGSLSDIKAVAKPLAVGVTQGKRLPSGGYDITHGTTVTGIDSHDRAPIYWPQETSAAGYADDIHQLLAQGD
jgi:protein SCO1/2